jgi:hypothetical protein
MRRFKIPNFNEEVSTSIYFSFMKTLFYYLMMAVMSGRNMLQLMNDCTIFKMWFSSESERYLYF